MSEAAIVEAVQTAQNAKAGNACDYSNKRSPFAVNECKEMMKGHAGLNSQ